MYKIITSFSVLVLFSILFLMPISNETNSSGMALINNDSINTKHDLDNIDDKKINTDEVLESYIRMAPKSYQTWYYAKKYLKEYPNVPARMAINILALETGFRHPLDFGYNPHQVSSAGALGPWQVIPSTGRYVGGNDITNYELKHNIEINSKIGIKYLSRLISRYGYTYAAGYYNTGYVKINDYAINAVKGI